MVSPALSCRPALSGRRELRLLAQPGLLQRSQASAHLLPGCAARVSQRTGVGLQVPALLRAPGVLPAQRGLSGGSGERPTRERPLQLQLRAACATLRPFAPDTSASEVLGPRRLITMSASFVTSDGAAPAQLRPWIPATDICSSASGQTLPLPPEPGGGAGESASVRRRASQAGPLSGEAEPAGGGGQRSRRCSRGGLGGEAQAGGGSRTSAGQQRGGGPGAAAEGQEGAESRPATPRFPRGGAEHRAAEEQLGAEARRPQRQQGQCVLEIQLCFLL